MELRLKVSIRIYRNSIMSSLMEALVRITPASFGCLIIGLKKEQYCSGYWVSRYEVALMTISAIVMLCQLIAIVNIMIVIVSNITKIVVKASSIIIADLRYC